MVRKWAGLQDLPYRLHHPPSPLVRGAVTLRAIASVNASARFHHLGFPLPIICTLLIPPQQFIVEFATSTRCRRPYLPEPDKLEGQQPIARKKKMERGLNLRQRGIFHILCITVIQHHLLAAA